MAVTAGAIASAIVLAYPIVESIIRETNSKKVASMRKDLNQILAKFNLKIENLRNELEKKGIQYNNLMDKLRSVSPSGRARQIRDDAENEYVQTVKDYNAQIADLNNKSNQYSALANQEIEDIESKGVLRTILPIK